MSWSILSFYFWSATPKYSLQAFAFAHPSNYEFTEKVGLDEIWRKLWFDKIVGNAIEDEILLTGTGQLVLNLFGWSESRVRFQTILKKILDQQTWMAVDSGGRMIPVRILVFLVEHNIYRKVPITNVTIVDIFFVGFLISYWAYLYLYFGH